MLVPNPGFLAYATLAKICGATAVTYDLDPPAWAIDVDALEKTITSKTKLIVVNSPSNPLGSVADAATLQRIAALGVPVVSDEFPVHLPVVGEIGAGQAQLLAMSPGTAVKIMTGAPVPAGADTVVPYEWTDRGVAQVRITRDPSEGQHVRRAGEVKRESGRRVPRKADLTRVLDDVLGAVPASAAPKTLANSVGMAFVER